MMVTRFARHSIRHEMPFLNSQFYIFHSPLDKAHFGAPIPVYRMIFYG